MSRLFLIASVWLLSCNRPHEYAPRDDAARTSPVVAKPSAGTAASLIERVRSDSERSTRALDRPVHDPCSARNRLEVMSFNVRYDPADAHSIEDDDGWIAAQNPRAVRVVDILTNAHADLVGLQEPLANQVQDLIAALPGYEFVGVGREDGRALGEFVGILYRRTRFQQLAAGHFWLSSTPDVPGTVFAGSAWTRMATWVHLRDTQAARHLVLLNTHLDDRSAESREHSARLIRSRLTSIAGSAPVLLTGDLNTTETTPPLQILLHGADDSPWRLLDAYRQVFPIPTGHERTFHAFQGTTLGRRIDFVLHTRHFRAVSASIVHTSYEGRYPSDHFPVTTTLAWTQSAAGTPCP